MVECREGRPLSLALLTPSPRPVADEHYELGPGPPLWGGAPTAIRTPIFGLPTSNLTQFIISRPNRPSSGNLLRSHAALGPSSDQHLSNLCGLMWSRGVVNWWLPLVSPLLDQS